MREYEETEGNGDGIISQVEALAYFTNVYYAGMCLDELKTKRDCFPTVPEALLVAFTSPSVPPPQGNP